MVSNYDMVLDILAYCIFGNIIIFIGIIGNFAALFILFKKNLLKIKTIFHQYLQALVISDLLFLFVNSIFRWVSVSSFINIYRYTYFSNCECIGFYDHSRYDSNTKTRATFYWTIRFAGLLHDSEQTENHAEYRQVLCRKSEEDVDFFCIIFVHHKHWDQYACFLGVQSRSHQLPSIHQWHPLLTT